MRVKQGKQYSTDDAMQLDTSLADMKADMSVVTLQVRITQSSLFTAFYMSLVSYRHHIIIVCYMMPVCTGFHMFTVIVLVLCGHTTLHDILWSIMTSQYQLFGPVDPVPAAGEREAGKGHGAGL